MWNGDHEAKEGLRKKKNVKASQASGGKANFLGCRKWGGMGRGGTKVTQAKRNRGACHPD